MNDLNFNIFNKQYLFISTKFYCFRDYNYFESENSEPLSLSRFLGNRNTFDTNEQSADFGITTIANSGDSSILNKTLKIKNFPDKKLLLFVLNPLLDINGVLPDSSNSEYTNIILTDDSFMVGDVEQINDTSLIIKYSYKNNSEVNNNNSIDTECRFIFTDENVEPAFNSDGYLLPSAPFNNII